MLLNFPCVVVILMFPSFIPRRQKTWANCGWQGSTSSLSHPGPGFYPSNLGTSPIFCGFGQWVQSAGDNVGDNGGDNASNCGWQSLTILDNPPLMARGTAPPHLLNSMCRVKVSLQKAKPHFHCHSFLPDLIPIPPSYKHCFSKCFSVHFTHINHQCVKDGNRPV